MFRGCYFSALIWQVQKNGIWGRTVQLLIYNLTSGLSLVLLPIIYKWSFMTQSLQKTILSFFVSAFMVIAFTGNAQAQDDLRTLWDRTTLTDNLPDWFSAGFVRGMAYGTVDGNERLYAADRTNSTIRVIDPATGDDVTLDTPFDLTGVTGGTYALNTVEVSDDGVIFLGNLSTDATASPFRLYWWDSEGGTYSDSLTLNAVGRLGDRFTVVGSVADNTVEVWIPAASSDPGIIYVATTADQGANWDFETITVSGTVTAIGGSATAMPFEPGRTSDFYVAGNALAPTRYDASGAYIANSQLSSSSRTGFDLFEVNSVEHLSVYTYRPDGVNSGNKTGQVYVYDLTDPTAPTIVAQSTLMGPDADSFSSIYGEARVRVNDDGSFNIYALDGVNGIAAYTNAEVTVTPLYFSEFIEGSGNNKAFEIYNPNAEAVDLGNYIVLGNYNGNPFNDTLRFEAGTMLQPNDVFVVSHADADSGMVAVADSLIESPYGSGTSYIAVFNGDDARGLFQVDGADTTLVDLFGDPSIDPGDGWDVADSVAATKDHTLLRNAEITVGNTTPSGSFATEWMVLAKDDISNLGLPTSEYNAVQGPLAGDYYIPQGDNAQGFASLADAFDAVNEGGLSDATTLYIAGDLDESGNILLLTRDDLSETNSLTIKPASGISPTLTIEGGSGGDGLHFQETAWVTIDGSNSDGGDTKDLSITSADPSFSSVIYVHGSDNIAIKNTVITYTGGDTGIYGIVADAADTGVENLLVENNTVGTDAGEFKDGVALWGAGETTAAVADVIDNEIFANNRGITTYWNLDNNYIGNKIAIVNPSEDRSFYSGIYLVLTMGETNVIGNEITNLAVNRTEAAGYAGGIVINATLGVQNFYNNIIAAPEYENMGAATGNSVYGIVLNNAAGNSTNSFYHNTILVGSSSETGTHAAFGMHGVGATAQVWDFTNNILSVNQEAENAYAMYWPADTTGLTANYNNYYVLGTSASTGYFGAGDAGAAVTTLDDWKTASGQDANSSASFVEFVSETDLRLSGESIGDHSLAGIPLAAVTTDIDGTDRSAESPYKGAYEAGTPVPNEIDSEIPGGYTLSQNYPNPFNPTSNIKFTLPQTADVKLQVYNMAGQLVSTLVNSKLSAGEHTVQFNAQDLASGVYLYRIQAGSFIQTKKMTLIK